MAAIQVTPLFAKTATKNNCKAHKDYGLLPFFVILCGFPAFLVVKGKVVAF
jgi:hypothetical protein